MANKLFNIYKYIHQANSLYPHLVLVLISQGLFSCKLPQNPIFRHSPHNSNQNVEIIDVFDSDATSQERTILVLKFTTQGSDFTCLTDMRTEDNSIADSSPPQDSVGFVPCSFLAAQQLVLEEVSSTDSARLIGNGNPFNYYHIKLASPHGGCLEYTNKSLKFSSCAENTNQYLALWRSRQERNRVALLPFSLAGDALGSQAQNNSEDLTSNTEDGKTFNPKCLFLEESTFEISEKNCPESTFFYLEAKTL